MEGLWFGVYSQHRYTTTDDILYSGKTTTLLFFFSFFYPKMRTIVGNNQKIFPKLNFLFPFLSTDALRSLKITQGKRENFKIHDMVWEFLSFFFLAIKSNKQFWFDEIWSGKKFYVREFGGNRNSNGKIKFDIYLSSFQKHLKWNYDNKRQLSWKSIKLVKNKKNVNIFYTVRVSFVREYNKISKFSMKVKNKFCLFRPRAVHI